MLRYRSIVFCLVLTTVCAHGQQALSSPDVPAQTNAQPEHVKVYSVGGGITAPVLLPLKMPPIPAEKCKKKIDGKVELSVLVDTAGRARNVMFLHPLGSDADRFALRMAAADRFNPGTFNGKPVVVAESLNVKIQSCLVESKDGEGKSVYKLKLRSAPTQQLAALSDVSEDAILTSGENSWTNPGNTGSRVNHVGGSTKAPIPLTQPEATYTDAARKARINGSCLISLIVDPQGMPQDVQIQKSLDPGLDQNAIYAVRSYRFKPAMRNGEPVPVKVVIEVTFKIW